MEKIETFLKNKFLPDKRFDVNDMLTCELMGKNELWIHIKDVRRYSNEDKLKAFKEGFKKITDMLINDPIFKNINLISATSWIAAKHPNVMKRWGFEVAESAEGLKANEEEYNYRAKVGTLPNKFKKIKPGFAFMSKNKFIELYS